MGEALIQNIPVTFDFDQEKVIGTAEVNLTTGECEINLTEDASKTLFGALRVNVHELSLGFAYSPAEQAPTIQGRLF